jgi:ring-1,2-phenylacetyl-CoA epoxidase subunit PaaC
MTTTKVGLAAAFPPDTLLALEALLRAMADDELIIGYWDSEWTGIAPILEEDVAMSSLAQDEIGHARALLGLLGELRGEDPDALAYDREVEALCHCRLLDHPRTDWAFTIARRYLYDEADAVRLEALADSAFEPLADLVAKIRREEVYHRMHASAWMRRLADDTGEARERLQAAWLALLPDAATVFTPLPGEDRLVAAGVLAAPNDVLEARWRQAIGGTCRELGLAVPGPAQDPSRGRSSHGEAIRWLWDEVTMVRRIDPEATW